MRHREVTARQHDPFSILLDPPPRSFSRRFCAARLQDSAVSAQPPPPLRRRPRGATEHLCRTGAKAQGSRYAETPPPTAAERPPPPHSLPPRSARAVGTGARAGAPRPLRAVGGAFVRVQPCSYHHRIMCIPERDCRQRFGQPPCRRRHKSQRAAGGAGGGGGGWTSVRGGIERL